MTKALHTTPKGCGRQHLSKLRDKIYINALQQRGRMTACHMAYIQLSLLGCNAVVVHGNTLSVEEWGHFETPMSRLFPIASKKNKVEIPAQRSFADF